MPSNTGTDDDISNQQPAKRSRTTVACQNCRIKKLACNGGRPCARCSQDDRECTDISSTERTPLTRKRMSELEERLANYELIWHELFPQLPLDLVQEKISRIGLDATLREIKATETPVQPVRSISERPQLREPVAITRDSHLITTPPSPKTTETNSGIPIAYPPTRPTSPNTVSVRIPLDLHETSQNATSAWNEDNTPGDGLSGISTIGKESNGATPGNDFGTGVRAGVGYLGLSSGLTLLRAIQKFAPTDVLPSSYRPEKSAKQTSALTAGNLAGLSRPSISLDDHGDEVLVLPPPAEIGPLVDTYFRYFHTLTPILHEPTIRAQITGALPLPTGSGSRVLFNMIFATGAFDAAVDDDVDSNGFKYYEKARFALQEEILEGGSLLLVQGLAIMAIWLQRCNKPNAGYVCLGLAIRMATALGAHVSTPASETGGLTVLESEMRSRIWWALVTLECGQCMTFGRPHGISLPSLSAVRLPVNTDDGLLTVSTRRLPSNVQHVTLYTALITQARLAQMAFHNVDRVSRSQPSPTAEQIKWCGDRFRNQLAAMPAYMQPGAPGPYQLARAVQVWRARDYQSVLYRPVLLSAALDSNGLASDETVQEIIDACRTLALQNLQDISEFVQRNPDPHRGIEWYTLYFAIQASLTILLSIVWEPHHPSVGSWHARIMETIMWLRQLCSMKELGMSYAQLMEDTLAARPNNQAESNANATTSAVQNTEQPIFDADKLDFERYLYEIWDGQVQNAGIGADADFGTLPHFWEDMATGMGGY